MTDKEAIYELEKEVVYLNKHIKSMRKEFSDNQNAKAVEALEQIKDKIDKRNNGTRNGHSSVEFKDGYSSCCCEISGSIDQLIKEYGGKNEL